MHQVTESTLHMPAEWEKHEATWIGWPHNTTDWPGKFAPIPWVYAEIARKIVPGESLRILVNNSRHERKARQTLKAAGADLSQIEFFHIPLTAAGHAISVRFLSEEFPQKRVSMSSRLPDFASMRGPNILTGNGMTPCLSALLKNWAIP